MGRTIRLYLVDDTPTGLLTAEIMNWTGKVLVAPRSQLADLVRRPESSRTGVYFLVGPDPKNELRECVYVGEGDRVTERLRCHHGDDGKEFWIRTIVVVSKDENLTKAHVRYLEARLIQMVREADRARLTNGTGQSPPPLPEPDVADMETFLEHVQLILPTLGYGFLQRRPTMPPPGPPPARAGGPPGGGGASPLFVIDRSGVRAQAREVDGEFVVLRGSTARRQGTPSWSSYRGVRDRLVEDGKLVPTADPEILEFVEDVAFRSPSEAGSVVLAANVNGRTAWRTADGVEYREWQERLLDGPGVEGDGEAQANRAAGEVAELLSMPLSEAEHRIYSTVPCMDEVHWSLFKHELGKVAESDSKAMSLLLRATRLRGG